MKTLQAIILLLTATILSSCYSADPDKPGMEFAPNMYHPTSYHPLKVYEREPHEYNPHGKHMRKPPEGTIARGKKDHFYPYPDTPEGYEQAGEELTNPIPFSEDVLMEGKRLYNIYCQNCHGEKGLGDGSIASKTPGDGFFPGIPKYNAGRVKDLSEGHIYHVITHGRNMMGSHSSQLEPQQRWKVVHYVQKLQQYDAERDEFADGSAEEVSDAEESPEEENDAEGTTDEENDDQTETENN